MSAAARQFERIAAFGRHLGLGAEIFDMDMVLGLAGVDRHKGIEHAGRAAAIEMRPGGRRIADRLQISRWPPGTPSKQR
jgi:hypothetical protein